jgi:hypothetical protein
MDEHRRVALWRTSLLGLVLILAFTLGTYSVQFSGSGLAWTALVLDLLALAALLTLLIRDFWKIKA